MRHPLADRLPRLGTRRPVLPLAVLPTPLVMHELRSADGARPVLVKHDERSGPLYGGNKVRKLEYLLADARARACRRIATFGAAGSNHALATALYAVHAGFASTVLLSHQPVQAGIGRKLLAHQLNGTEVIRFGGSRADRVAIQRQAFAGRRVGLLPMGGSNWIGTLGFVNAALEVAEQLRADRQPLPDAVYVATGTLGTTVGLALGFALAGLSVEVRGIRVTAPMFASEAGISRLVNKTALLMRRCDPAVPDDLAARTRIVLRHEFFGPGYGESDAVTEAAIAVAAEGLGLRLDSTYTGKAMAALLHDLGHDRVRLPMFWNTCNAIGLELPTGIEPDFTRLPAEFARYFTADSTAPA